MVTSNPLRILGISGSLRKGSYNTALLRTAAELMPPGMKLEIIELTPLPIFNQDFENPFPEAVAEFRTRLAQADRTCIVGKTPNHARGLPKEEQAPRFVYYSPSATLDDPTP